MCGLRQHSARRLPRGAAASQLAPHTQSAQARSAARCPCSHGRPARGATSDTPTCSGGDMKGLVQGSGATVTSGSPSSEVTRESPSIKICRADRTQPSAVRTCGCRCECHESMPTAARPASAHHASACMQNGTPTTLAKSAPLENSLMTKPCSGTSEFLDEKRSQKPILDVHTWPV